MLSNGKKVGAVAFALTFLGYQLLIHKVTISGQVTPITAALVLIPFIVMVAWVVTLELGLRLALLITTALALFGLAMANMFGLPQPAIIFGLPHLVTNLFLMWFFARTLKDGRKPLITAIAQRVHGSITPDLEIYTRQVTWAWSLFFALQMAVSTGLYMLAPLQVWSIFINVLNWPLIVLMFICEYTYRVLRYRDHRSSIFSGLRFFSRETPASKSSKVR